MARRSLKPQLNQIRTWVRQGRTDAWIAHQLEATVQQIATFKQENDLMSDDQAAADGAPVVEDLDLRAEDDALIAAELEAEAARRAEEAAEAEAAEAEAAEAEAAEAAEVARAEAAEAGGDEPEASEDAGAAENDEDGEARPRRRGRRGGRGRGRRTSGPAVFEGTFDHGEEGYGLWLDPSVADSKIYAEHWSGNREVAVTVEADQIIIRRAGEPAGDED